MLRELLIRDFVLIDEARITFGPALNVVTGETGAGKSVLVGALLLALGGRAAADMVRAGAAECQVAAVFEFREQSEVVDCARELLARAGVDCGEELLLRRRVRADGRSSAFINDTPVTLKTLETLGEVLIDFHGQHEHQSLLRPGTYLQLLDLYGGHQSQVLAVRTARETWQGVRAERDQLAVALRERSQRLETLSFEVQEINAADLQLGEEQELEGERRRLGHVDQLALGAARVCAVLSEGEEPTLSVMDLLGECQARLEEMLEADPGLNDLVEEFQSAVTIVGDGAARLIDYRDRLEADPGRLEQINARLHLIARLKRKYGNDIAEMLAFRDRAVAELADLEGGEERLAVLDEQVRATADQACQLAGVLSKKRRQAGEQLARQVTGHLKDLGMEAGLLKVEVSSGAGEADLGPAGWDRVELLIRTNVGSSPKALRQTASGGEISRVMLAIKAALAEADPVDVQLFDEIDAGVGGTTAHAVADKLVQLAGCRQTLVITHLPQIAGRAQTHLVVRKASSRSATVTSVSLVEGVEREQELMRMLGDPEGAASRQTAQAMLGVGAE